MPKIFTVLINISRKETLNWKYYSSWAATTHITMSMGSVTSPCRLYDCCCMLFVANTQQARTEVHHVRNDGFLIGNCVRHVARLQHHRHATDHRHLNTPRNTIITCRFSQATHRSKHCTKKQWTRLQALQDRTRCQCCRICFSTIEVQYKTI